MQRFLLPAVAVLVAGLCITCVVQWQRESGLRAAIHDFAARLNAETVARNEAETRIAALEAEVTRISGLRDDLETRYQQAAGDLQALSDDSTSRGHTILALADLVAGDGGSIQAQNEAIEVSNERLRALAAERDDAIRKLNARTREYNDLVRKVNAERRRD